jgi:hypothetical protein
VKHVSAAEGHAMFDFMFTNPLSRCQSACVFALYRCGFEIMDSLLAGANPPEAASRVETETPRETLPEVAMKRLKSGYAPPREIYDVRNRGQINWSCVPDWARPVDPELFEIGHEG